MKYKLIIEADGSARIESDGETIWQNESGYQLPPSDEMVAAILEDSNFGQPQRDALKAVLGLIDIEREDGDS